MLKTGIIGNVNAMVPLVHLLKNIQGIQVIGKSSIGMMEQTEAKGLSIPECNRRELFETADILIIDNSRLLHFDLIKTAIKNNKHLYFCDFPDLSPESCMELLKLAGEAKTGIHIRNILMTEPLAYWVSRNFHEPVYLSFFEAFPELPDKRTFLIKYLLYAQMLFGNFPQKIRTSGIDYSGPEYCFINLRLDYSTYSTLNLEIVVQPKINRSLRAAMPGKFLEGNCISGKAWLNQSDFPTNFPVEDSIVSFLKDTTSESLYARSNLNSYHSALLTFNDVLKKTELYTPWH
jgi:hypothetical protein